MTNCSEVPLKLFRFTLLQKKGRGRGARATGGWMKWVLMTESTADASPITAFNC